MHGWDDPKADVLRLVVGRSGGLALAGIALGALGALWATRVLRGMLYDVTPTDPGVLLGVAAMMLTPAAAFAGGTEYAPEPPTHPTHPTHPVHPTPGPNASLPEKAKAYGVYCRGFSKKHLAAHKGTPFSNCVNAMAKAASSTKTTAKAACKGLPKTHVKGEKGTEFSRCVVAAAQVKKSVSAS